MRRLKVTYRPEAIADLQDIYRIVFRSSLNHTTATRYVRRIMARCRRIGNVPLGGRSRDDLEQGLRTVPFERKVVIAYRVTDTADITNVFYGGRDYEALYRGAEPEETEKAETIGG
jgi:toxin ParE1/3/4